MATDRGSDSIVLELNDAGVGVWRGGERVLESPGFALVGAQAIEAVGEDAWARSRLQPRAINDRFWDELSLEPLARGVAGLVRTPADIACEHLGHVWQSFTSAAQGAGEVFVAVPGHYGRDQLGLLLGIARECGMQVAGMMDAALAAVARAQPGRTVMHLDVHLHRTVVTRFTQGDRLSRAGVESTRGAGLRELHERWIDAIARSFIEATRFDPLHRAENEQALYQQLRGWLERLRGEGRIQMEISAGGDATHSAAIDVATLRDAVGEQYGRIVELVQSAATVGEPVLLHLSHRASRLPGLADLLRELPAFEVRALPADAVASGVLACEAMLRADAGEGVAYFTQIPWLTGETAQEAGAAAAPAAEVPETQRPTHLVYQGLARPLGAKPLRIGSQVEGAAPEVLLLGAPLRGVSRRHCEIARREADGQIELRDSSSHGTFVNGRRVDGTALLRLGDRLRIGTPGHEMQLVRVTD